VCLSSQKMFQFVLNNFFLYLVQLPTFLDLRYVSVRYDKRKQFDLLLVLNLLFLFLRSFYKVTLAPTHQQCDSIQICFLQCITVLVYTLLSYISLYQMPKHKKIVCKPSRCLCYKTFYGSNLLLKLLALPANIRLGWKVLLKLITKIWKFWL
jgi:hypothetical protein